MHPAGRFLELLSRFTNNTLTTDQEAEFKILLQSGFYNDLLDLDIREKLQADYETTISLSPVASERILNAIIERRAPVVHRVHFLKTAWLRYAAAILLISGVAGYIFLSKQQPTEKPVIVAEQNKQPGTDRATLTLSDGRQVVLENANNQNISDGNISIGNRNGILSYNTVPTSETNSIGINTMTTPRGGQYQLVLPDGSRVWLNSASSLKYPVVFNGSTRTIELTGEAYFEIKENKTKPFILKTNKLDVQVLGTEFNMSAYKDEPKVAATLINGSIKVVSTKESLVIKPGQQASLTNTNERLEISNPLLEDVLAWREGIFQFENVDIQTIMRQIARWYDVDVVYEKDIPQIQFSGSILRTESPLSLFKALEKTDRIYFIINGKKVTVHKGNKSTTITY